MSRFSRIVVGLVELCDGLNALVKWILALALIAVCGLPAFGDKLLVVPAAKSGRQPYVYDTETGEKTQPFDGAYYEGTGGPTPTPPPTPIPEPPPPTPGDPVATAVEAAARKANQPSVAVALSKAYLQVVDLIKQHKISASQAALAIKTATEFVRKNMNASADWDAVVTAIEAQAVTALQAGHLETEADWIAFANSVAVGLDAASGNAVLGDFFKQLLQALIQALIQAILDALGGGGTGTGGGIDLG